MTEQEWNIVWSAVSGVAIGCLIVLVTFTIAYRVRDGWWWWDE